MPQDYRRAEAEEQFLLAAGIIGRVKAEEALRRAIINMNGRSRKEQPAPGPTPPEADQAKPTETAERASRPITLLANMSHDLRTALNAIIFRVIHRADGDKPSARSYVEYVHESAVTCWPIRGR
jgi:signal transduction histidine kinase